ncbi:FAD/NAD(P)-binding domain-containing protein [Auriscalpium vulgare]|uniref:FAD/NAD(P)-binding domain-containing protein n=1 Tax=Auriscalpium vulgare TaxID=40419 RepID=A0ACB8S4T0_9AGAM|nr:FAD/NAD(P)-binding domain-containing protein [Auriscalpium vulgare]
MLHRMGLLARLALSTLGLHFASLHLVDASAVQAPLGVSAPSKRIAIVGAGTGGVGALKALIGDLPEEARQGWEIVLFEQRRDVGGIWLPDPNPPNPPELPETPLYPRLLTNTPHPTMTLPNFPFRPGTPLYPRHPAVQQYHRDIVEHWNLSSYIKFNHEVLETRWRGTSEAGRWQVAVRDRLQNETSVSQFDHLIVASGHNHYPFEPIIPGRDLWEAGAPNRKTLHSIYYRQPQDYAGRNVVVVGGGASTRDIAQQIAPLTNSTYVSLKPATIKKPALPFPPMPGTENKPRISHFTSNSIVFTDNTTLTHIDTIVWGTGYELRIPFLTAGGHLDIVPTQTDQDEHLSTNLRRVHPVYQHVLSLDTAYPVGALYFIGLPIFVSNAISDAAQGLFAAYTLAYPELLDSRGELYADLLADETRLRADGYDCAYIGHRIPGDGGGTRYQDGLVEYLQARGLGGHPGVPRGRKFTEQWRVFGVDYITSLKKGWVRIESRGEEYVREWLDGVETEEQWADLMERLVKWEREQEEEEGSYDPLAYTGPEP